MGKLENQFVVGVADVRLYDGEDNLILSSKTMLNSSMEISTGSTEISGGKRNKLLNIYYHSGRLNLTLEDTVFNMEWIRDNAGGKEVEGFDAVVPYQISTSSAVIEGLNLLPSGALTPQPLNGSDTAYIYINGNKYAYANGGFTTEALDENIGKVVCLEYFVHDASAVSYTIPAAIMPKRVRAFLNVDLASNKAGEGVIGQVIIEIPVLQLSGAQTINMTADGYSTTPLSGMALAFTPTVTGTVQNACGVNEVYAIITKQVYGTNWYDDVVGLAVVGGDLAMEQGTSQTIQLVALKSDGTTRSVVYSDLTATVTGEEGATGLSFSNGVVTAAPGATVGNFQIEIKVTGKPAVNTDFTVEVEQGE